MSEFSPHGTERRPRPAHRAERGIGDDLGEMIEMGIEIARQQHRDIDPATARSIAHVLAQDADSALESFVRTGVVNNDAARREYLPLYADKDLPGQVRQWIDWLGAFLVRADSRSHGTADYPGGIPSLKALLWATETPDFEAVAYSIRADTPPEISDALPAKFHALIADHGDAFRVFLSLDDVDAATDNLEETFSDTYVGTFGTRDQALRAATDMDEIEKALGDIEGLIGAEAVHFDTDELWDLFSEVHDVVEEGGHIYVFTN